ncbi:MAG: BlaI/MecI/CopY family transcriptional regulator [Polyangiales bacterium]
MEIPLLGDLEMSVLEHLWAHGTVDAKDVHRVIGEPRDITLSTIQSTLERLHRKRLLIRERVGHAYRYAPALSRAEFRARAMASAGGDLKGADAAGVLAAFVDLVARADTRKLDQLAELVAAARAQRKERS